MVTPTTTLTRNVYTKQTHTDWGVFVLCGGVSKRAGARREEAELGGGSELREGSQEDGEDGGEGGHPPAAYQRQDGSHPAERGERYALSIQRLISWPIWSRQKCERHFCLFVVVKKQPEEEDEEEDAADQPQEFENGMHDLWPWNLLSRWIQVVQTWIIDLWYKVPSVKFLISWA